MAVWTRREHKCGVHMEGPALNTDLVRLVLVLEKFVTWPTLKEFEWDIIVEWPLSAEFVATV
jgi:hypothetical protein